PRRSCAAPPAAHARRCQSAAPATPSSSPANRMTHADVATLSADPTTDAVTAELEAMHAIAAALARVRDPQVRLRVPRWATDRFQPTTALHAVPPTLAGAGAAAGQAPTPAAAPLYE